MRTIDRLLLRLRSLFRRDRLEHEMDEEMRFHLDQLTQQKMARGMSAARASEEARREFGGVALLQEECRDKRSTRWLEEFVSDLRYATRIFAKSPGFTAVALLSLALGIGANTAIFTLVEAVVLRTLPVREPAALVQIVGVTPGSPGAQGSFSLPSFEYVRNNSPMFSTVFTWTSRTIEVGSGENMGWITVDRVSDNYFTGLGVAPILGRALGDEKKQPAVAVLSHNLWQRRFHGNPGVLGESIRLGGFPFTIVGILPQGFSGAVVGASPDLYVPLAAESMFDPNRARFASRNSIFLPLMARLKPGTTFEQASAAFPSVWGAMLQATGPVDRQGNLSGGFLRLKSEIRPAATGISQLRARFRKPLWILVVVVGVVLLIACVNLSNFLLARSLSRQREVALRLAVGAGRGRLLRQMLTENLLLAVAGAGLGLVFALWSSRLLTTLLSSSRDTISLDIRPNFTLLLYTAAITILTTLLFGLAPALRALRTSVQPLIKEGTHQITGSRTSSRALLVVQVALSLLLVTAAALFLRTFQNLLAVDLGFDASRVLIASIEPARVGIKNEDSARFAQDLQARLATVPGVESVSFSRMTPIQNCCWWDPVLVKGYTPVKGERVDSFLNTVAPGFFSTMGTRLLLGRDFDFRDVLNSKAVVIVNESYVKKFIPTGDPLGRVVSLVEGYNAKPMEIIGVVEDARYIDLRGPSRTAAYFPLTQFPDQPRLLEVLIRTSKSPMSLASSVRQQVHSFHPAMPIKFRTLEQEVEGVLTYERLLALLSGFFGAVALALAAIGLYGVLSYSVSRRTAEIGVRIALGASQPSVLWLVLRQCLLLVLIGLAIGCTAAVYMSRYVESMMFGVKPTDPFTFAIAAGVLGLVALFAAWLPARRAAAIDPLRALRYE